MADRWFLEKKGKFYGPFKAEKVLGYAESGKIATDTMVSRDGTGKGAQPFSKLEAELRKPEDGTPGPKPEPPLGNWSAKDENKSEAKTRATAKDKSEDDSEGPPQRDEPEGVLKEWYVATPERRFGPYSLDHLEELLNEGKLNRNDMLQKEGESHLSPVSELFPAKPPPPAATKKGAQKGAQKDVKKETNKGAQKDTKTAAPKPAKPGTSKRRRNTIIVSIILLASLLGGLIWLNHSKEDRDPRAGLVSGGKALAGIKRRLNEASPLRRQLSQAELPPFNQLAMDALREGLNFKFQTILDLRKDDIKLYVSDGPKNFGHWFPDQVRREAAFVVNDGYVFTYLAGFDNNIFAVVINHENLQKNYLASSIISDFSPKAKRGNQFGYTTWSVDALEDLVDVKALWGPDNNGEVCLQYLIVLNANISN